MNKNYYVIRNSNDVIWCWKEEAFEKMVTGWDLYAIVENEKKADALCEEACY